MAEEKAEKPVVESFQLDHTKVKAPYVRYIDTETGPHGDVISNYDLRLTQPNKQAIPTGGLHTIEHTIAVLLRERIPGYIDCSPFGCRTGFHLLTWGTHSTEDVAKALKESLEFIAYKATWDDVPATTRRFEELKRLFNEKYGCNPDFFVRAPGRVNLIGEYVSHLTQACRLCRIQVGGASHAAYSRQRSTRTF